MSRIRLVRLAFVTALAVLASVLVTRVFNTASATVAASAVALVAAAVAHLVGGRRWLLSLIAHAAGSLVSLGVLGLILGGNAIGAAPDAGARLLSTGWPAPLNADLAAVAVLPSWFAGALGTEMLIRSRRRLAPLIGPVIAAALGLAASVPAGSTSIVLVAVFAALCLGTIGAGGGRRSAEGLRRILVTSGAVALSAVLVAPVLVAREPADPRSLRADPVVDITAVSPLSQLRAERTVEPVRPRFEIASVDGDGVGPFWRVAALTDFDGRSWVPSDRLQPTSSTVGDPVDAASSLDQLVERDFVLTAAQLVRPWVPVTGRPVTISQSVRTDRLGGSLISDDVIVEGSSIRLRALPPVGGAELTDEVVAVGGASASAAIPGDIGELAREITTGADTTIAQLDALSGFFRDDFELDEQAPPGHSIGRLRGFLLDRRSGSTEQFVAAYTLMARSLGLPARVAVGYRLPDELAVSDRAAVSSDMASAWPEVRLEDVGWVPFELGGLTETARGGQSVARAGLGVASGAPVPATVPTTLPPDTNSTDLADPSDAALRRVGLVAGVAGLSILVLLSPLMVVPLLKRRRAGRRRRSGAPAERVAGAWLEAVDLVNDAGGPVDESATNVDLVRAGADTLGDDVGDPMHRLARRASTAAFAAAPPGEDAVAAAWSDLGEVRDRAGRGVGRMARIRRRQSLRSLGTARASSKRRGKSDSSKSDSAERERDTVDVGGRHDAPVG